MVGTGLLHHTATADAMPLPPLGSEAALGGSTVYAADGKTVLAVLHASQERKPIDLSQVSKVLITAVLDTEDHRFYQHGGFDIPSTIRALANDSSGGRAPGRLDHHPAAGQADLPDARPGSSPARSKKRSSPIGWSVSTPRTRSSRPTSTPSTWATAPTESRPPPTSTSTSTPRS